MPERIKKGTIRGMAQPYLQKFISMGLSANETIRRLREVGLGYRRTDMLADIRMYRGVEKAKDVGKYIRKDRFPTESTMVKTVLNQKRKYNSFIHYKYLDLETQEVKTKAFFVAHDEPLTVGSIEQAAGKFISENADEYGARPIEYGYRYTRVRYFE